ncbi:MAG: type I-C CRISPR-associated protein Cas7/Csd2 [Alphaproteobacteria bacterium]|nr:type I-C CRISPR-associated protein Cas7/Csd2 [Alphaproteobacteria bacterium]
MTQLTNRYDFVVLFDVINGNPNGDPDAGNMPRIDPQTNHGLVTDVCLKRKIRDFVNLSGGEGNAIFVLPKEPLNPKIAKACEAKDMPSYKKDGKGWETDKAKKRSQEDIRKLQEWLCLQYFDVRTFGAVMSTGPNAGQIRGPVQFSFARSIEPIFTLENTITRVTDVDEEEGEMGRKHIVPYALYRAHGFVSAKLAQRTGFSESDLETLLEAVENMFEHDRSAARGEMAVRKLIVFKHEGELGNAPAHTLFDLVEVGRKIDGECREIGDPALDNQLPARSFADYCVKIDRGILPEGVEIIERL